MAINVIAAVKLHNKRNYSIIMINKIKHNLFSLILGYIGHFLDFEFPDGNYGPNEKSMNSTSTKNSEKAKTLNLCLFHWKSFKPEMNKFKSMLQKNNENKYTQIEPTNYLVQSFGCHDHLLDSIQTICNSLFHVLHPYIFKLAKPNNKRLVKGDSDVVFFKVDNPTTKLNEVANSCFLMEIKTKLQLPYENTGALISSFEKKKVTKARKAVLQTFNYMVTENSRYGFLSRYDKTWCFFRADDDNLFVSECIGKDELFLAIYYTTSLLFPNLHSDDKDIEHFLNDVKNEDLKKSNKQAKNTASTERQKKGAKTNTANNTKTIPESEQVSELVGSVYSSSSNSNLDFNNDDLTIKKIRNSTKSGKVLGEGACGIVLKVALNNSEYALKLCDIFKTSQRMIDELKNERAVLKCLENKVDCIPKVFFSGMLAIHQSILMSFIDGYVFDEFEEMSPNQQNACMQSLDDLHKKAHCLHGDIRAPNFILDQNGKAFIIDFGRSKVLDESITSQKKFEQEMALLSDEMSC